MRRLPLVLIAFCLLIPACDPRPATREFRVENKENLGRLKVNMPKSQALAVMGSGLSGYEYDELIRNPYRVENLTTRKGTYEVYYFYTEYHPPHTPITDDQLTPLVIRAGRLMGWGWNDLNDVRNE